jgi:hypothetical protein
MTDRLRSHRERELPELYQYKDAGRWSARISGQSPRLIIESLPVPASYIPCQQCGLTMVADVVRGVSLRGPHLCRSCRTSEWGV